MCAAGAAALVPCKPQPRKVLLQQVGVDAGAALGVQILNAEDDLSALINAYNAGDQATLTIQRNGEQMELSVTFGESVPEK